MRRTILLIAGAALLVYLVWQLGPAEILNLVRRVGWSFLPVLPLYAGHIAARALALRACVPQPDRLDVASALAIRLSGEAVQSLTSTGPFLSEPTRAWLLTRRGLTLQEGLSATIAEYLISSFLAAGMAILALLYIVRHFDPSPIITTAAVAIIVGFGVFLVASAVAIWRRFYLIGTIAGWLGRIGVLRGRLRPDMAWVNGMEDLLLAVLRDRPGRLGAIVLLEAISQVLLVLELAWLLSALQVTATPLMSFLVEGATKFIGVVFIFVPLQLGTAEGTYAVVFDVLGMPAAAGFALAFVRRIRSIVVASIGLATMAHLTREKRPGPDA